MPKAQKLVVYNVEYKTYTVYKDVNEAARVLKLKTGAIHSARLNTLVYKGKYIFYYECDTDVFVPEVIALMVENYNKVVMPALPVTRHVISREYKAPDPDVIKPKNKDEEDLLRRQFGMYPYGKWAKYVEDHKAFQDFIQWCIDKADEEDGRCHIGALKRQRVAGYWMDSGECFGVWESMTDAANYCDISNMSAIVLGKIDGAKKKNMTFRKLMDDEEDPEITNPYIKEEEQEDYF